jgi:sporulation protein YlmC with PRC-barrel domain
MKPVLGKNVKGRKVVSSGGLEIGEVLDVFFETNGKITHLSVKPDRDIKELREHLDKSNLVSVPYESVRAIGRYVIIDFPFSK